MNILSEMKSRFHSALAEFVADPAELLAMIRPSQDAKFGDYQANCAMPLGKQLGKPPREVAAALVEKLNVTDLCRDVEIAGPGFINLRLKDEWLVEQLTAALHDERLGIRPAIEPRTYVIDYSSPNVAKPMHVGHIRSTVIGDALCHTLRFMGHRVISDNHLGDWGTQFGMIIYGYKHFVDREAYQRQPVAELTRLYKLVNRLVEYHEGRQQLPQLQRQVTERAEAVNDLKAAPAGGDKAAEKRDAKLLRKLESQLAETQEELDGLRAKLAAVDADPQLSALARQQHDLAQAVSVETAKLHADDEENLRLWHEFLPHCRADIQRVYDRLGIRFDHEHGESFYHSRLAAVVDEFVERRLARESERAVCVFLDGFDTPMIIRKKDGAYLYATTDLATIEYRMKTWQPDAILYVVDHRQGEHFSKLFAAARLWGCENVELQHISFGTVLGEDGRPFKTRSGESVGLEDLLDEAVRRAHTIVCENDDAKPGGGELSPDQRQHIANVVGIAALKYADLAQNRTSDYVFSFDKMLAMNGNTATYMQYSYARVNGIFTKGGVDIDALRSSGASIALTQPAERALALGLLRFEEALDEALLDYRPSQLTSYLFELTKIFFTFYENCSVLKAESPALRDSRLLLCDQTARTIKQGLALLGINVVDRM
jgi:arginyl-tRNA synthetase